MQLSALCPTFRGICFIFFDNIHVTLINFMRLHYTIILYYTIILNHTIIYYYYTILHYYFPIFWYRFTSAKHQMFRSKKRAMNEVNVFQIENLSMWKAKKNVYNLLALNKCLSYRIPVFRKYDFISNLRILFFFLLSH